MTTGLKENCFEGESGFKNPKKGVFRKGFMGFFQKNFT